MTLTNEEKILLRRKYKNEGMEKKESEEFIDLVEEDCESCYKSI